MAHVPHTSIAKFFQVIIMRPVYETLVDSRSGEGEKAPQNWSDKSKSRNLAKPSEDIFICDSSQGKDLRTLLPNQATGRPSALQSWGPGEEPIMLR